MIHNDFAWTFATDDTSTVKYIRDEYIPWLKNDIAEMQAIVARCLSNAQATDAAMSLQEAIGRQKQKLEAAESQLHRAVEGRVRHGTPPKLAIVIEGGLVRAVVTNQLDCFYPELEVQVIDYDIDGADEDELVLVPQGDGTTSEACCHVELIAKAGIDIDRIKPKAGD